MQNKNNATLRAILKRTNAEPPDPDFTGTLDIGEGIQYRVDANRLSDDVLTVIVFHAGRPIGNGELYRFGSSKVLTFDAPWRVTCRSTHAGIETEWSEAR